MACFLVAATEAVVVTAIAQVKKHHEKLEPDSVKLDGEKKADLTETGEINIPWSRKLMWLAYLLWGGVVLLAFEHIWHGEVVPWFPFLTAAANPGDTAEMLHEMSTIGVTMIALVTGVWGCLVAVINSITKRAGRAADAPVK